MHPEWTDVHFALLLCYFVPSLFPRSAQVPRKGVARRGPQKKFFICFRAPGLYR